MLKRNKTLGIHSSYKFSLFFSNSKQFKTFSRLWAARMNEQVEPAVCLGLDIDMNE